MDIKVKITKKEMSEGNSVTELYFDIVNDKDKKWFGKDGFIRLKELAIKERKRKELYSYNVRLAMTGCAHMNKMLIFSKLRNQKIGKKYSNSQSLLAKSKSDNWRDFLEEMKERRNKKREKEKLKTL